MRPAEMPKEGRRAFDGRDGGPKANPGLHWRLRYMADEEPRGTVLLVESDAQERERLAAGLEDAGFEVTLCPGPTGPDYTCVGARTLECPLAKGASVVVLDMWLEGEDLMEGTPAEELIDVYLLAGHRVIALARSPSRRRDPRSSGPVAPPPGVRGARHGDRLAGPRPWGRRLLVPPHTNARVARRDLGPDARIELQRQLEPDRRSSAGIRGHRRLPAQVCGAALEIGETLAAADRGRLEPGAIVVDLQQSYAGLVA